MRRYFVQLTETFHQDQFYDHFMDTLTLYVTLTSDMPANILTGFTKLMQSDLARDHFHYKYH